MSTPACNPGAFRPRPVTFRGVHQHAGWSLKLYSLAAPGVALDWPAYERVMGDMLRRTLPSPAATTMRAGVGFVIAHQGADHQYLVINWWDRSNELFTRTFVRASAAAKDAPFVELRDDHAICVWDLEIIWAERNAYVKTMMTERPDVEAYLAMVPLS